MKYLYLIPLFPLLAPIAGIIANSQTHDCPLTGVNAWGDGNILLGGAGSDTIEGRGADDIIDGDKYLDVRLSVRDVLNVEIGSAELMESRYLPASTRTLQQDVMAGIVDPGNIVAVREILSNPNPTDIDTAVFSDVRANYDITLNADGSVTVAHARGTLVDGTDTLFNIERLKFSNTTIPVPGTVVPVNAPATGVPAITGVPTVGLALAAGNGTIVDTDGISAVTFAWEQEGAPDVWTQVATGASFTPAAGQVGHRLRVVATVLDNIGGSTGLTSDPTVAVVSPVVVAVNRPATGTPIVVDRAGIAIAGRPRVNDPLTVDTSVIADLDGLVGVLFRFQWQRSADGGTTWTDIVGANTGTFAPLVANVGNLIRVRVSFTDQLGFLESRTSAATRDVRAARGGAVAPVVIPRAAAQAATVGGGLLARGLPRSLAVPSTTTVVRVQVFAATGKTAIVTGFITVKRGSTSVRLRKSWITRVLNRSGAFRFVLTPGVSKAKLGRPMVRIVNVHRATSR